MKKEFMMKRVKAKNPDFGRNSRCLFFFRKSLNILNQKKWSLNCSSQFGFRSLLPTEAAIHSLIINALDYNLYCMSIILDLSKASIPLTETFFWSGFNSSSIIGRQNAL